MAHYKVIFSCTSEDGFIIRPFTDTHGSHALCSVIGKLKTSSYQLQIEIQRHKYIQNTYRIHKKNTYKINTYKIHNTFDSACTLRIFSLFLSQHKDFPAGKTKAKQPCLELPLSQDASNSKLQVNF